MVKFIPEDFATKLAEDGIAVLHEFITQDEVQSLRNACTKLLEQMDADELPKVCFSTENSQHHSEAYFIESGDKIRPFFEEGVFDKDTGTLNRPIHGAVNKIGHALHVLEPTFSAFTLGEKLQALAREGLGMVDPRVVQSMYIFKPPGIGGSVTPHRDESFLRTEPEEDSKLVGIWLPLDSATKENGCLWYVPGSHKRRTQKRFVRVVDPETGRVSTAYEGVQEDSDVPESEDAWVAAPVEPGSCVLIHGSVLHKSEKNTSPISRHAYTFHIMDFNKGSWSPRNWLQLPEGSDFAKLC